MPNPNLPINAKYNTYVGARYVPTFANSDLNYQWTSQRTYEPLQIVLYQGNSFTSTTFVPVGIDINNTTYWAETGNYNAQVEQYRQDVIAVQNQISQVESDIDSKETGCLYIGNSYTVGVEGDGLYEHTKDMWDNSWMFYDGGAGFLPYTGHTTTYVNLLTNAYNSPTVDNSKVTHILFISAVGDSRAWAQNQENYKTMLATTFAQIENLVAQYFPNCKRIMVAFAEVRSQTNIADSINGYYYCLYNANMYFQQVCQTCTIEYLGWVSWALLCNTAMCLPDNNNHPSQLGYAVIAKNIKQAIFGNYTPPKIFQNYQFQVKINNVEKTGSYQLTLLPDESHVMITVAQAGAIVSSGNWMEVKFVAPGYWPPLIPSGYFEEIVVANTSDKGFYSHLIGDLNEQQVIFGGGSETAVNINNLLVKFDWYANGYK